MCLGYHAFENTGIFQGKEMGLVDIDRFQLYDLWKAVKDKINTPIIIIHFADENWGMFSSYFPNRTVEWGHCCDTNDDISKLPELLNHPKVLMFLTNQHLNFSHPKLLPLPRGLPGPDEYSRKLIWDTGRVAILDKTPRDRLLFTATSR
jgi:hypothetical protein